MAVIYLIRHGQASWGQPDYDALSDVGLLQASVLGECLLARVGPPDRVIAGSMRRHQQTAQQTLAAMGISTSWQQDARWNEYDHEELLVRLEPAFANRAKFMAELSQQENPRQCFQALFDRALQRWISGETDDEYQESWPSFQARVAAALESVLEADGTTIVFTSGGVIGAVVARLWNLPNESWLQTNRVIANAATTKLVRGRQGLHLLTFNEHSHFEGSGRQLLTYR